MSTSHVTKKNKTLLFLLSFPVNFVWKFCGNRQNWKNQLINLLFDILRYSLVFLSSHIFFQKEITPGTCEKKSWPNINFYCFMLLECLGKVSFEILRVCEYMKCYILLFKKNSVWKMKKENCIFPFYPWQIDQSILNKALVSSRLLFILSKLL